MCLFLFSNGLDQIASRIQNGKIMKSVIASAVLCCRRLMCECSAPTLHGSISAYALRYCSSENTTKAKWSNATAVKIIQDQLKCGPEEAIRFRNAIQNGTKSIGDVLIINRLKILIDDGITVDSIMKNPWLLGKSK